MQERPVKRSRTLRRLLLLAASIGVLTVGWFLLGEPETIAEETSGEKVLARIGDLAVTADEVNERAAAALAQIARQRHELIAATVRTEVRDRLLDLEAEKRGITKEELMKAEVEEKLSEVPQADVDAFYEERKARIRQPKENVEEQIRKFLGYEAFIARLEKSYGVDYLIEPYRVKVPAEGPARGPEGAPVTIVEFSDFECPHCGRVSKTLEEVRAKYGDKVRIVFRQFPLQMHANARKAAEAALCAGEQGRFWELHDLMFADQRNLGVEALKEKAATIAELDPEAFAECLDSGRLAAAVDEDVKAGAEVGVSATPAFFINGRFGAGALDAEAFAELIDDELSRLGKSD